MKDRTDIILNKYSKAFLFVMLVASNQLVAQRLKDPCMEKVRSIYKQLNDLNKNVANGQQIFYRYTTKVLLRDSVHHRNSKTDVQVTIGQNKIQLLSAEAEYYEDQYDAFNVLPGKKIIFWADSRIGDDNSNVQNAIIKLQDTLFYISTVKECRVLGHMEKIVLEIDRRWKRFEYHEIEFWINPLRPMIHKIVVHYPQSSKVLRIEYVFQEIDPHHHDPNFQASVRQKIFSSTNQLAMKYKGYKVIDSRIVKKTDK